MVAETGPPPELADEIDAAEHDLDHLGEPR
jgi:hypothetical protein